MKKYLVHLYPIEIDAESENEAWEKWPDELIEVRYVEEIDVTTYRGKKEENTTNGK